MVLYAPSSTSDLLCRYIALLRAGGLYPFTRLDVPSCCFCQIVKMHCMFCCYFNSSGAPVLSRSGDSFLMRANISLRAKDHIRMEKCRRVSVFYISGILRWTTACRNMARPCDRTHLRDQLKSCTYSGMACDNAKTSRFPRRNRQIKLKWPSLDKSLDPPGSLGEEDVMLQATFDPLLKHWGGTREIINIDRLYSWEYIKITVNTARCLVWRKKGSTTQLFADMCALPLAPLLDSVPKTNRNNSALVWVRHSAPPHNHRPLLPHTDAPLPQWCGTRSTVKGIEMGNIDWTRFSVEH